MLEKKEQERKQPQLLPKSNIVLTTPKVVYKIIRPADIDLEESGAATEEEPAPVQPPPPVKNRPGRRKGVLNKKKPDQMFLAPNPGSRTRSGRVSRPPRHIEFFANGAADAVGVDAHDLDLEPEPELPQLPRRQRRFKRHKCASCGKLYVSEHKLSLHLAAVHDHVADETQERIDCFNYLLRKLKKIPLNLRGKMFLDELEEFIKKIQVSRE